MKHTAASFDDVLAVIGKLLLLGVGLVLILGGGFCVLSPLPGIVVESPRLLGVGMAIVGLVLCRFVLLALRRPDSPDTEATADSESSDHP